jgi:phosphoribosylformylglycinamidine synthase
MSYRLEITAKVPDARAQVRQSWLNGLGFPTVSSVEIIDVYTIDKKLSAKQLAQVTAALTNPITQSAQIFSEKKKEQKKPQCNWAMEIGFLPGVTDNIATTTKEMIADLLGVRFAQNEGVYSSQLLLITGELSQKDVDRIASSLANPLIQSVRVKNRQQFLADGGMGVVVPRVKLMHQSTVFEVNLNVSDEELVAIGKSGIADADGKRRGPLALDLTYMKAIQTYFKKAGRNPTDIELETLAQAWSEHCKHTIFADPIDEVKQGLFKTYIKAATQKIRARKGKKDFCASVFTDNSGAIEFDENFFISHKVETHNSPSALDPFGGSVTGIVGVNRDAIGFGLGAKPVINMYGFCFTDPQKKVQLFRDEKRTQPMLSPRRIMDGVVAGVNAGGNCSGIPTPQGFVHFDDSYRGKPLVFVGTVGLIPKKIGRRSMIEKKARPDDLVVMIGGRVGLDGIHGATFSSESLDSGSPATAVQIGDPITQKKLSDALVKEVRDLELFSSITDDGAGGLSCSVVEMAREAGGCEVDLEKVPLKYPGLEPWQIWISESQERMTLAVPKKNWKKLQTLLEARGVEASVIGKFTNSGKCVVKWQKKKIVDLEMEFIGDGLPVRHLQTAPMKTHAGGIKSAKKIQEPTDFSAIFLKMLSRPNLCSTAFISQQYDHEVQGGSVLKPVQGRGRVSAYASVTRPVLTSAKGVVLSQAMYPRYSNIDPYQMTAAAIDTAIRNVVSVGANPEKIALLDNFCWCSSNDPERLWQLKRAAQACYEFALQYQAPFISGKDSMFNDFSGFDEKGARVKISILPTLLISAVSVMDDAMKCVSLDAKFAGDLIYVLGETHSELDGSEYADFAGMTEGNLPTVDAEKNKKLYTAVFRSIQKELLSASISVSIGGLSAAFAKLSLGGLKGIDVSLKNLPGSAKNNTAALFSESQGRFVVTVRPSDQKAFEKILAHLPYKMVGVVTDDQSFSVKGVDGRALITTTVEKNMHAYRKTFAGF